MVTLKFSLETYEKEKDRDMCECRRGMDGYDRLIVTVTMSFPPLSKICNCHHKKTFLFLFNVFNYHLLKKSEITWYYIHY
jgi:hypothetical protein